MNYRTVQLIFLLVLVFMTGACSLIVPVERVSSLPEDQAAETPVLVETPAVVEAETAAPGLEPTATLPPIRFEFSSPGAPPQSAWRPPLYPVPWAPTENDHFYFIRPIAANEVNWPNGSYRYGGVFFENSVHSGVDIGAPEGTPVLAAGPGKVVWADYGLVTGGVGLDDPYGLAVVLRHDFGFDGETLYTLYAHLSRLDVIRGQRLETGQVLGAVGDTGFTTGPHLHFEVRLGSNNFVTTFNPELWIAPPEGWGVLVGRIMGSSGQVLHLQPVTVRNLDTGQIWESVTYGDLATAHSDPYYRENFVLGDLPAGKYEVSTPFLGRINRITFEIFPGRVTYFNYKGRDGFAFGTPDDFRPTPTAPPETLAP